ncbi:MAG: hypothetical protein FWC89_11180 [Defluviitaleaceae bacterium]|nr:hypothetical protein [Defluviitaleaceae bacterium]
MSKRMGEELIEAMQELLDYSENKIELRTSSIPISPDCEVISPEEIITAKGKFPEIHGLAKQV